MKTPIAAMLAVCVTCACSSGPEAAAPAPAEAAAVNEIAYACDGGQTLVVRFYPYEERAVMIRGGEEIELQQQVSGSGIRYSNGPTTILGKGDDLTVEIGRMVPLQCKAS